MRSYRKHLSGEAAFKSFVPTPLSEIQVIHTEELDKLIMETEKAQCSNSMMTPRNFPRNRLSN